MDHIVFFREGDSLSPLYSDRRLSYTRPYKAFFPTIYEQIGKVIKQHSEEILLFYVVQELQAQDVLRIRSMANHHPDVNICLCGPAKYALQAWRLNVFHFEATQEDGRFVVKQAYHKYTDSKAEQGAELVAKTHEGIHRIPHADILYIKADGNYTEIYLRSGKKIMQTKQLGKYTDVLENDLAMQRVHRSLIINLKSVKTIASQVISFYHCSQQLTVSANLERKIKRLMLGI